MSKRLRVPFLNWDQSALNSHSISYLNCIYGFAKSQITYMWNGGIILTHLILIEVQYLSWKLSASTCHYCCCVSCEIIQLVQFNSVAQSCPTLCDPMNHSTPGLPVHPISQSSLRFMSIESVMLSSHLILCHPLLLLPPIPPSIRVFSNESTLRMRWPNYWSFSFSIIPSKEIPGLISFRMD